MERQDLAKLLSGTEAFSSASPKAIELLLEAGEVKAIADSYILIREGAMGESIWMLLEGKWVVNVKGERANEIDRRGSVVGEISAVSHTPATATVKSEGGGRAFCIPQEALHRAMTEFPELAGSMLRSMAKYLGRL